MRKAAAARFLSKQGHLQAYFHAKARQPSAQGKWLQLRFNVLNILENKRNVERMLKPSLKSLKLSEHRFNILSTCFNNTERGWQTLSTLPFNKIERMLKQMLKPFARAFTVLKYTGHTGMIVLRVWYMRNNTTLIRNSNMTFSVSRGWRFKPNSTQRLSFSLATKSSWEKLAYEALRRSQLQVPNFSVYALYFTKPS